MELSGHDGSSPNRLAEQKEVTKNESGQVLLPQVRLKNESGANWGRGKAVRFLGYWVSAERDNLEVSVGEFDDTDLSDHSDWTEAWQNEDPEYAHGFLDPLTMLHDLSKKIAGELDAEELELAATKFREGIPCPVNDLQDLARLIQLLIPKALPKPPNRENPDPSQADDGEEIPF